MKKAIDYYRKTTLDICGHGNKGLWSDCALTGEWKQVGATNCPHFTGMDSVEHTQNTQGTERASQNEALDALSKKTGS